MFTRLSTNDIISTVQVFHNKIVQLADLILIRPCQTNHQLIMTVDFVVLLIGMILKNPLWWISYFCANHVLSTQWLALLTWKLSMNSLLCHLSFITNWTGGVAMQWLWNTFCPSRTNNCASIIGGYGESPIPSTLTKNSFCLTIQS